jgi:hypothetical protein
MTPRKVFVLFLLLALPFAGSALAQTSTLSAETGNNTSAVSFPQHDNGNVAPGNVSKLDTHTLLYPGATTSVYAHFLPWFCTPGATDPADGIQRCNGHILSGYNSNDATVVKKQVDDMISRGIQGVIIDWYGSSAAIENGTSLKMMAEAQSRNPVFQFTIMEDKGAVSNCMKATGSSDETQCVIDDLSYVASTYFPSPAYMHKGGRPVVFFYIDSSDTAIDWDQVRASAPGNPLFIFQDNFSRGDGAFSWVHPEAEVPDNASYLDGFYSDAQANPGKHPFGSTSKGFNDFDADPNGWSKHRSIDQQCGSLWLRLAAQVSASGYSASSQLESYQLVTWNDYDEGTEIESGIDNCLSISASVAGNTLSWTLAGTPAGNGQESTIDRYRVWSTPASDGQSLTLRREVTAGGSHSLDLTTLGGLTPGTAYTIYVQAIGKPSILNHMANGVSYTPGNTNPPPSRGAVITSPGNGASSASPVHVSGYENSGTAVDMQIYLDGGLVYDRANVQTITADIAMGAGSHSIAVKSWYSDGTDLYSTVTVNVSSGSPRGVTITSPAGGGTVGSPVHVVAYENSGDAIDMQIYLDDNLVFDQANIESIDTQLTMGSGSHRIVVKSWYSDGTDLYSAVTFTVQ